MTNSSITKKSTLVSIISTAIIFALVAPLSIVNAQTPQITRIRGQVFGPDGNALRQADVTVTCDGVTKTDRTGGAGRYNVLFSGDDLCEAGTIATITVTKDGLTGSGQGTVQSRRDGRFVDRNILLVDPINAANVPEFGVVAGAFAALIPAAAYLRMRRRV